MLACVAALFVVLKFLFHIHFSYFGFGFWAARRADGRARLLRLAGAQRGRDDARHGLTRRPLEHRGGWSIEPPHLRRGEMLAGAGALALLVILFALPWLRSAGVSRHGWAAVPVLRWVIVAAALSCAGPGGRPGDRSARRRCRSR